MLKGLLATQEDNPYRIFFFATLSKTYVVVADPRG
jgi:hypothetical protein